MASGFKLGRIPYATWGAAAAPAAFGAYNAYNAYRGFTGTRKSYKIKKRKSSKYGGRMNKRTGGFQGIEVKFLDTFINNVVVAQGTVGMTGLEMDPVIQGCLNSPTQNTSENGRIGRHIWMQSIAVTGIIRHPGITGATDPHPNIWIWVALVLDTQTNQAAPDSEDVWDNPGGGAQNSIQPLRNLEHTDQYKVLVMKKVHLIPRSSYNVNGDNYDFGAISQKFEMRYNLKSMKVLFAATGDPGSISDIADNSLHVMACSTDQNTTIFYNSRLRFTG